jgi:hypothetical protein
LDKEIYKPSLLGMLNKPSQQFEMIKSYPLILRPLLIISFFYAIGLSSVAYLNLDDLILGENKGMPNDIVLAKMYFMSGVMISGLYREALYIFIVSLFFLGIAKVNRSNVSFRQLFSMNTHIEILSVISILLLIFNDILYKQAGWISLIGGLLIALGKLYFVAKGLKIVADLSKRVAWTMSIIFFVVTIIMMLVIKSPLQM